MEKTFPQRSQVGKIMFPSRMYIWYLFSATAVLLVPGISEKRETDLILWAWAYLLSSLNSCLNSLIFFWFKPMLRKEAKKVLKIL